MSTPLTDWIAIVHDATGAPPGTSTSGTQLVPVVTSLTAGTPAVYTPTSAGYPAGNYTQVAVTYTAPNPLGTGTAIFSQVHWYVDDGSQTLDLGMKDFTGSAGGNQTDTLIIPLLLPNSGSWTIYAASASKTYSNPLAKVGSASPTPYVTVTFGASLPPPTAAIFQAGEESSTGTWTSVMYWSADLNSILIDWLVALPASLASSGLGGVAIWVKIPNGFGGYIYDQSTPIHPLADFQTSGSGATAIMYLRGTIQESAATITPGQSWTFIAVSYDTLTPPQPMLSGGEVTGPTVTLTTPYYPGQASAVQVATRPISIVSVLPTLPVGYYPAGSLIALQATTGGLLTLYRVNAAGTAWEKAINGGSDIQAGTITADRLDATTVNAAYVTAAYAAANYATFGYVQSTTFYTDYLTVNVNAQINGALTALTISAGQISGGTLTVGSGGVTVQGAISGTTVTLNLNGITTTLGNLYNSGLGGYVGLSVVGGSNGTYLLQNGIASNTPGGPDGGCPFYTLSPSGLAFNVAGSYGAYSNAGFDSSGNVYATGINIVTGQSHGGPAQEVSGQSYTITLAKLTTGGSNGSITVVSGIVTSYTAPT